MGMQVKALEEICFAHILETFDEYPAGALALLPASIRHRMLLNLPVVDVCKLEKTKFVADQDMETIWKMLYTKCIDEWPFTNKEQKGWREHLLSAVCECLIADNRPYGYFQLWTRADKSCPWVGGDITDDHPVHNHPADFVNYLVARKREQDPRQPKAVDSEDEEDYYLRSEYGPSYVVMKRHTVTRHMGVVPPPALYHKAAQLYQAIPRRHAHLFPEGSCFLPDSTAISLITGECGFHPTTAYISCSEFSTFVQNAQHESGNMDAIQELLRGVETLGFRGEVEDSLKGHVMPKAKTALHKAGSIPSLVFNCILSQPQPRLSTFTINIDKTRDEMVNAVSLPLTTSFGGIKELTVIASGSVRPDLKKLIAITDHQSQLESISISITEIEQIFGYLAPIVQIFGSFDRNIVRSTPKFSSKDLLSWVNLCFKKPSLSELYISVKPIPVGLLQELFVAFLSSPCSHDQTMTIGYIRLKKDVALPSSPPPCLIDDNCTLEHKSLVLENCGIDSTFFSLLFGFQPLKLKQLIIKDLHYTNSVFTMLAQQTSFDVGAVKLTSMSFRNVAPRDYELLLKKPSLRCLHLENCSQVDLSALAAALPKTRMLVELCISFTGYRKDECFTDNDALQAFFNSLFSLPQLPQFSLALLVALTSKQAEMLLSSWKRMGEVQMKSLEIRIQHGNAIGAFVSVRLQGMATNVNIKLS